MPVLTASPCTHPHSRTALAAAALTALLAAPVSADGSAIDKIYDPYVQPLERELEYRVIHATTTHTTAHKVGYGQAVNERWFAEIYGVDTTADNSSDNSSNNGSGLDVVAVEAKWQLTEQGEFANDWALLFELERESSPTIWEATSALIMLHEWSRWVATVNAGLTYEWGAGLDAEWESAVSAQLKFRHSRALEPGLEIFWAQETRGIGPVLMGSQRLGGRRSLFWEVGAIAGIDADTPDITLKSSVEFEF